MKYGTKRYLKLLSTLFSIYTISTLLIVSLLTACGPTDTTMDRQVEQYREKVFMYKYKSKLYLDEIHKTAELLSTAGDRSANTLVKHIIELERDRQHVLYQMRQFQRRLEEYQRRY